jgi:hypothetical protein
MVNQGASRSAVNKRQSIAALQKELEAERERRIAAERLTGTRRFEWVKQLAATVTALGALLFTGLSLQQSRAQNGIAEQGQITGRYTAAIDQLGSPVMDVRLGGIYALHRIMTDSPSDQPSVVSVLSAFIRDHPPGDAASHLLDGPKPMTINLPTDIEAALGVLEVRNTRYDGTSGINLAHTDLATANLAGADLTGAVFTHANLHNAILTHAHLAGADFTSANLMGANLVGADLVGANLDNVASYGANLSGANLTGAHLGGWDLAGVNLTGANLCR